MMVTGDYHHTALAVARGVGMISVDKRVVIIQSKTEFINRPVSKPLTQMPSALKSPRPASHTLHGPRRAVSFRFHQQPEGDQPTDGQLRFQLDNGDVFEDGDALRAFTSIAQGQAQCCVSGPAFEHMLQHEDLSVVETVMRNVVVFARMRSHQKGQVMDLLGARGLHQVFNGQQLIIPVSCNLPGHASCKKLELLMLSRTSIHFAEQQATCRCCRFLIGCHAAVSCLILLHFWRWTLSTHVHLHASV